MRTCPAAPGIIRRTFLRHKDVSGRELFFGSGAVFVYRRNAARKPESDRTRHHIVFCGHLFQLVTLPVEFNASSRAKRIIVSEGMIRNTEERGVSKVLDAAALTYVAAALVSLFELLRFVAIFLSGRND